MKHSYSLSSLSCSPKTNPSNRIHGIVQRERETGGIDYCLFVKSGECEQNTACSNSSSSVSNREDEFCRVKKKEEQTLTELEHSLSFPARGEDGHGRIERTHRADTRVHVSELSFTHPVNVLSDVLIPDCIPGIGSDQMPANGQGFDSLFPFPIYTRPAVAGVLCHYCYG